MPIPLRLLRTPVKNELGKETAMDGSAFRGLGKAIDSMVWWAMFGLICAGLLALGGIGFAVWWAYHHIQIV